MAAARVLLIGGKPETMHRVGRLLNGSGYEVFHERRSGHALRLLRSPALVDLAVVDAAFPRAGSLLRQVKRLSPSTATLLVCRPRTNPVGSPGTQVLREPFSLQELARVVQRVLAKSAKARAALGDDLARSRQLLSRQQVLAEAAAEAAERASAAILLSRRRRMFDPLTGHCSQEALEEYSFARLDQLACQMVEVHLLACDECQAQLAGAENFLSAMRQAARRLRLLPLDYTHCIGDAPVRLRVKQTPEGRWRASLGGEEVEPGTGFPTVAETNEHLLDLFQLRFPDHECDERCFTNRQPLV